MAEFYNQQFPNQPYINPSTPIMQGEYYANYTNWEYQPDTAALKSKREELIKKIEHENTKIKRNRVWLIITLSIYFLTFAISGYFTYFNAATRLTIESYFPIGITIAAAIVSLPWMLPLICGQLRRKSKKKQYSRELQKINSQLPNDPYPQTEILSPEEVYSLKNRREELTETIKRERGKVIRNTVFLLIFPAIYFTIIILVFYYEYSSFSNPMEFIGPLVFAPIAVGYLPWAIPLLCGCIRRNKKITQYLKELNNINIKLKNAGITW